MDAADIECPNRNVGWIGVHDHIVAVVHVNGCAIF